MLIFARELARNVGCGHGWECMDPEKGCSFEFGDHDLHEWLDDMLWNSRGEEFARAVGANYAHLRHTADSVHEGFDKLSDADIEYIRNEILGLPHE